MGAGKTTVGRLLADGWGVALRDTDADVEAAEGRTDRRTSSSTRARTYFREREREAVLAALAEHDGVLALGGGAVLDQRTRAALAGQRVVFLRVGLSDAVKRVGLGHGRPLLLGNVRSRVKAAARRAAAALPRGRRRRRRHRRTASVDEVVAAVHDAARRQVSS